jgi:hypothetical protein
MNMEHRTMTFSAGHNKEFAPLPTGSHVAVCDAIIMLGIQPGSAQYPTARPKIYLRWQVPGERTEDGRPMVIGATLTASMHEKSQLRKLLQGWRGKAFSDAEAEQFDVSKLLGQACFLSVVESTYNGKTYTNVQSVSRLPRGTTVPSIEGEGLLYWNVNDSADQEAFRKIPEWLQKKITAQLSPQAAAAPNDAASDFSDDDIPF